MSRERVEFHRPSASHNRKLPEAMRVPSGLKLTLMT